MADTGNWKALIELVTTLKKCDDLNLTTPSLAMAFIFIDTFSNLARPAQKTEVTRQDFINWVDEFVVAHPDQPYKYRGKDVYAARCAFLHTYGSEATIHTKDKETIKFGYNNGGKHYYNESVDSSIALIGVKSFINDIVGGGYKFLEKCDSSEELKQLVESRLEKVLSNFPIGM